MKKVYHMHYTKDFCSGNESDGSKNNNNTGQYTKDPDEKFENFHDLMF
jgi:hypothetical protein